MAIALKVDQATGRPARTLVADSLEAAAFEPRTTTTNLLIGATLSGAAELRLHASGRITRVMGQMNVDESVIIAGNLDVLGVTTSFKSANVLVEDNHFYMNSGYETAVAQTGGLVVNYLPIATIDTVDTGGFTNAADSTVATIGAATFAVGQFIQISNADSPENNGLFEVLTHAANVLTIKGVSPVEDFTQSTFVTDATVAGTITRVTLSVMRAGTDGIWETGVGAVTPISFTDLGTGAGNDLQAAYDLDPAILIDATGPMALSNGTTSDDLMSFIRTFVGGGNAITLAMGPGNEAVTGRGISMTSGTGMTGVMHFINNLGTGNAFEVQDAGTPLFILGPTGAILATGQIASVFSALTGNLTLDAIAGELVLDDTGSASHTWSQAADRSLDATGAGEVLNGATSALGAINRLARAIDQNGQGAIKDSVIEDGVTITAGDTVAQSSVSGRVTQMDASADTNAHFVGIALETGTGDGGGTISIRVALPGNFVSDSGASFTANTPIFAPDGTGRPVGVGSSPTGVGDVLMRIGWAHSTTEYVIHPGPAFIL